MLNIMDASRAKLAAGVDSSELHFRIEAMKLAYADLVYDGDPHFSRPPIDTLLSKTYAAGRAASIDPQAANCKVKPGTPVEGDTTYLAVVDREGNSVSWIQSVSSVFGSGVTVDGMGFVLHNRASKFTLQAGTPNSLSGGKRPLHTIIPAVMEKGEESIAFGIMGGPNQPLAHAQFVSNVADFHMNLQEALDAPRFTKRTPEGCEVWIESRFPLPVLQELSEKGHEIRLTRPFDATRMGRGQAVLHNSRTGMNYGASDPRADGAASAEPIVP